MFPRFRTKIDISGIQPTDDETTAETPSKNKIKISLPPSQPTIIEAALSPLRVGKELGHNLDQVSVGTLIQMGLLEIQTFAFDSVKLKDDSYANLSQQALQIMAHHIGKVLPTTSTNPKYSSTIQHILT